MSRIKLTDRVRSCQTDDFTTRTRATCETLLPAFLRAASFFTVSCLRVFSNLQEQNSGKTATAIPVHGGVGNTMATALLPGPTALAGWAPLTQGSGRLTACGSAPIPSIHTTPFASASARTGRPRILIDCASRTRTSYRTQGGGHAYPRTRTSAPQDASLFS